MDTDLQLAANLIGPNATLLLRDVKGQTILDVSGRLWITQHGDARDIFLDAGQSFSFDRDGAAVVQALGNSAAVVAIQAPALAPTVADDARPAHAWTARRLAAQAWSALGRAWERLRPGPAPAPAECAGCAS